MSQSSLFKLPEPTGKKASKAKPADVVINRVNRELAKERYYLHKQLDKAMFTIKASKRLIKTDYRSFEEIPVGPRYYVNQLLKMRYKIQYELIIK